jgi:hypothetical protein
MFGTLRPGSLVTGTHVMTQFQSHAPNLFRRQAPDPPGERHCLEHYTRLELVIQPWQGRVLPLTLRVHLFGTPGWIRTSISQLKRPVSAQLSYGSIVFGRTGRTRTYI